MLIVEYSRDGELVSDFNAELYADQIIFEHSCKNVYHCKISSEIVITYIRIAVLQGRIDIEDVVFIYGDNKIKLVEDGLFDRNVDGFCDRHINPIKILLDLRMEVYRDHGLF